MTVKKQNKSKEEIARENLIRESEEAKGLSVKGYDLDKGLDYSKLLDSFATTGAQATNFARAVEIIKKMRKEKCFIYLGYTSNMVTTGVREIIRYLAEHKLVDYLITSAGGIEEDFIKCLGDFKIGDFNLSGKELRDKGINRAGNILIPNSRYCDFEDFVVPILEKHKDEIKTPAQLIKLMGLEIGNKESIYYWCAKNEIPVFCPAIMDGSLGDMIYFFKSKHKDFSLDIVEDTAEFNNSTIGREKTGIIILGGGVVKHCICNANMYRNGADYAVYINTGQEFDASDSGARPDEAVSWGKISKGAESVKVFGDATILFPLIASKSFVED
jgi:deoxyhypusine synthase